MPKLNRYKDELKSKLERVESEIDFIRFTYESYEGNQIQSIQSKVDDIVLNGNNTTVNASLQEAKQNNPFNNSCLVIPIVGISGVINRKAQQKERLKNVLNDLENTKTSIEKLRNEIKIDFADKLKELERDNRSLWTTLVQLGTMVHHHAATKADVIVDENAVVNISEEHDLIVNKFVKKTLFSTVSEKLRDKIDKYNNTRFNDNDIPDISSLQNDPIDGLRLQREVLCKCLNSTRYSIFRLNKLIKALEKPLS